MVTQNRLEWVLQQLHCGRQARISISTHIDRILIKVCLLPLVDQRMRNVVATYWINFVLHALPDTVAVDHGHRNSQGESHISILCKPIPYAGFASAAGDAPDGDQKFVDRVTFGGAGAVDQIGGGAHEHPSDPGEGTLSSSAGGDAENSGADRLDDISAAAAQQQTLAGSDGVVCTNDSGMNTAQPGCDDDLLRRLMSVDSLPISQEPPHSAVLVGSFGDVIATSRSSVPSKGIMVTALDRVDVLDVAAAMARVLAPKKY